MVFHADSALMHAIIRNAHCPDPRCAGRFRIFGRGAEPILPAEFSLIDRPNQAAAPCCPANPPEPCC